MIGTGNIKRMEDVKKLLYAGCRKADYEAAQELYDFICRNVQLPDVTPNPFKEFMRNLKDGLVPGIPEPDKKKDVN